MALTAVFDANILFSATAWRGNPFQCVERARVGTIQAVTGDQDLLVLKTFRDIQIVRASDFLKVLRRRFG